MMAIVEDQIFASPPEPLFNVPGKRLPETLVADVLTSLILTNQSNLRQHGSRPKYFIRRKTVECILRICDHLQQQQETRFSAIQLLDRFLAAHIWKFFNKMSKSEKEDSEKVICWKEFLKSLKEKGLLYMLTCVQLASKLYSYKTVIPIKKSLLILRKGTGQEVNANTMIKCELEVLQTIDYQLPLTTPLTYVETLLELLGSHKDWISSVKVLHNICLKILDVVFLMRDVIYQRLYKFVTGSEHSTAKRSIFSMVENDDVLLAAAVIGTAAHIACKETHQKVIHHLSYLTKIPTEDIVDLATVLVENILESTST